MKIEEKLPMHLDAATLRCQLGHNIVENYLNLLAFTDQRIKKHF